MVQMNKMYKWRVIGKPSAWIDLFTSSDNITDITVTGFFRFDLPSFLFDSLVGGWPRHSFSNITLLTTSFEFARWIFLLHSFTRSLISRKQTKQQPNPSQ